jgi:hypothetical protein
MFSASVRRREIERYGMACRRWPIPDSCTAANDCWGQSLYSDQRSLRQAGLCAGRRHTLAKSSAGETNAIRPRDWTCASRGRVRRRAIALRAPPTGAGERTGVAVRYAKSRGCSAVPRTPFSAHAVASIVAAGEEVGECGHALHGEHERIEWVRRIARSRCAIAYVWLAAAKAPHRSAGSHHPTARFGLRTSARSISAMALCRDRRR